MTTPFPFVTGQVLTAAQLNDIQNLPISDKTASYTLLATDVFKRTIMNSASATTITVDDLIFTEGDVIQVANKGAGTCTITAGAGVTINTSGSLDLAQYGGGYLLALSASTFTFFNLGGGATSVAVDYLIVAGGAGGGFVTAANAGSGGGGAGGLITGTAVSVPKGVTMTVTVGAKGNGELPQRQTAVKVLTVCFILLPLTVAAVVAALLLVSLGLVVAVVVMPIMQVTNQVAEL